MEAIGKFFAYVILLVVSTVISGLVLMKLWAWFIAGTFGVIELNLVQSIGLSFVVHFLTAKMPKKDEDEDFEDLIYGFFYSLAYSGIAILFGWILSAFL